MFVARCRLSIVSRVNEFTRRLRTFRKDLPCPHFISSKFSLFIFFSTNLAGVGRGSSISFSQGRAARCTYFSEVCETLGSLKKDSTAQFLRAVTKICANKRCHQLFLKKTKSQKCRKKSATTLNFAVQWRKSRLIRSTLLLNKLYHKFRLAVKTLNYSLR